MRLIIDRIEEEYAVCELENRQMKNIPLKDIPFIPREGDVLIVDGNNYRFDVEETERRKKKIEEMTKGLWN